MSTQPTQKLQKVLAMEGLGSRRAIEKWIAEGRCTVNGKKALLGARVSAKDKIAVDGRFIKRANHFKSQPDAKLLLYYKKPNEICSAQDPEGRPTVFENLPPLKSERWVMVGRLDFNTTGLLLFTTDGLLSHRLLHPRYEIEREYAVRVHGEVTVEMMHTLQKGVLLDGKMANFASIIKKQDAGGANHWYHVILKEGRQREVRRLFESQGVTVTRLMRVRFGPIVLPTTLRAGRFVWLSEDALNQLRGCVGL